MIVSDFDLFRVTVGPDEANSILAVDPDRVLPLALPLKGLKLIRRRRLQIMQAGGSMHHEQLAVCHASETQPSPVAPSLMEEISCPLVLERLDHNMGPLTPYVKRKIASRLATHMHNLSDEVLCASRSARASRNLARNPPAR